MSGTIDNARAAIQRVIMDPANHDALVLLKAVRNGAVYGVKVRFPHAVVMTFLFKTGSLKEKLIAIFKMTRAHSLNLATFALTYKLMMYSMRASPLRPTTKRVDPPSARSGGTHKRKEYSTDSFIAGTVAGYVVFGRPGAAHSSVNQQIVIYVFARVCLALAKLAITPPRPTPVGFQAGYSQVAPKGGGVLDRMIKNEEVRELWRRRIQKGSWPVFASVSWGLVMWLFRYYPDVLQPSLKSSMKYLYENAETWDGLRNLIWHNL